MYKASNILGDTGLFCVPSPAAFSFFVYCLAQPGSHSTTQVD